jgi:hypothetical protein
VCEGARTAGRRGAGTLILGIEQEERIVSPDAQRGNAMSTMSKQQLLQQFVAAYEQLIEAATQAAQHGVARQGGTWGPREVVAHLAGWEVMATVRIPRVVAGMPPLEFADQAQQTVMNDAINAAFVTLTREQPLETLCGLLRQSYRRTVEILGQVDERFFQPGEYLYERTRGVIEHCQEHREEHLARDV